MNDFNPRAWLTDILVRLPDHPIHRVAEHLPWAWKPCRETPAGATTAIAA